MESKSTGKMVMVPMSQSRPYERLVASAARAAGVELRYDPVFLTVKFFFHRPKCHLDRKGLLAADAPRHFTKAPDVDKLLRAVMDALTGVAYKDDAQVCRALAHKMWVFAEDQEGTMIEVGYP